jgi:hypothetical protein
MGYTGHTNVTMKILGCERTKKLFRLEEAERGATLVP